MTIAAQKQGLLNLLNEFSENVKTIIKECLTNRESLTSLFISVCKEEFNLPEDKCSKLLDDLIRKLSKKGKQLKKAEKEIVVASLLAYLTTIAEKTLKEIDTNEKENKKAIKESSDLFLALQIIFMEY